MKKDPSWVLFCLGRALIKGPNVRFRGNADIAIALLALAQQRSIFTVWSLPSAPGTVTVCPEQPGRNATGGASGTGGPAKKLGGHRWTQSQGISYVQVYIPSVIVCLTSRFKLGWVNGPPT